MNSFIRYFKGFKWTVLVILAVIALTVLPAEFQEGKYAESILVGAVILFILTILIGLDRFFCSMATGLRIDDKYSYFSFAWGKVTQIAHSEVQKVKITPYRYVFYLSERKQISLLRITGAFSVSGELDCLVRQVYSEIVSGKGERTV